MMQHEITVLFVDDDNKAGDLFLRFSQDSGFHTRIFHEARSALDYFNTHGADVVVTDLRMPGMDGLKLLEEVRAIDPEIAVIMMTGFSTVDNAVQAMKLGAADFIKKPYDMDEMINLIQRCANMTSLKRENRLLKRQLKAQNRFTDMIGRSSALEAVQRVIDKISDIRCNVIIEGESGTGKELVARAIHDRSQDAGQPFVVIDCGAMTESLLESELFGHEKGAFTGAAHSKRGLLEMASGGTVFLDEIANISDAMQMRLLRVVQENELLRVGGLQPVSVDLRFIAASNRNLEQRVAKGRFREDFFHRLNVIKINMPALRERREDIPRLAQHFVREFADRYQRQVTGFTAESMRWLSGQHWPGNIRELKNLVERHVALAEDREMQVVPLMDKTDQAGKAIENASLQDDLISDWPSLKALERRYIEQVLAHTGGNRQQTASLLGINKSTLWRKLKP